MTHSRRLVLFWDRLRLPPRKNSARILSAFPSLLHEYLPHSLCLSACLLFGSKPSKTAHPPRRGTACRALIRHGLCVLRAALSECGSPAAAFTNIAWPLIPILCPAPIVLMRRRKYTAFAALWPGCHPVTKTYLETSHFQRGSVLYEVRLVLAPTLDRRTSNGRHTWTTIEREL
jgi:hypothetical protein